MKKLSLLAVFGLLVLLGLLVTQAPAGLVARQLDSASPLITVAGASGTAWNGAATLTLRLPTGPTRLGQLQWDLAAGELLRGKAATWLTLSGDDLNLRALAWQGSDGRGLRDVNGTVGAALLNYFMGSYDITLANGIDVKDLAITLGDDQAEASSARVSAASGDLAWSGGLVTWRLAGQSEAKRLPPLVGTIAAPDGGLALRVSDGADRAMVNVSVQPDGWASVQATRAFLTMTGTPWHGSQRAEEIVVEVQEKVF